jgi:tRNA pseudouridine13 synthase
VVVRGVSDRAAERARPILGRIMEHGLPNAFGPQRFGRGGANPDKVRAWLRGEADPPRDRRARKLLVSALQAELFNALLARRLHAGHLSSPLRGDVMKVHASGGMFVAHDVEEVAERARRREVSPTGPIYGARMWWPEGEALALEEAVLAEAGLSRADLDRLRRDGQGSRRPLRVLPEDLAMELEGDVLTLSFVLDPGTFATALLAEVTKGDVS